MRILVTGGAGYLGAVLCRRLIDAGHVPVVLDRLFWGSGPLEGLGLTTIAGDVRDWRDDWLLGIDAVAHLAGLSNDPTAEYNTEANWQMNAVAAETIAAACRRNGIGRLTFASSASIYDTERSSSELNHSPVLCDEETVVQPRGAYSLSKQHAERVFLEAAGDGFAPTIMRQATVFGYSPRMRFDLVVNTFLKDAVIYKRLLLHGGGWMWRPLVDVEDIASAHIRILEAPIEAVRSQIFNVVEENYQIRQLAMLVAGSLALLPEPIAVHLVEAPLPPLTRNYRMSSAKLSRALGFTPSRTVLESVEDMLRRLPLDDIEALSHPRHHNIKWMTLLETAHREQASFQRIY